MRLNTLLTTIGYVRSLIEKKMGLSFKRNSLNGIYNYHLVSSGFKTSGQPTARQFTAIRDIGINTVLNLAPTSAENSLENEAEVIDQLGMAYVHIPVDFKAPTDQDFARFVEVISSHDKETIWVHCAANMRVSAFIYRYRCEVLGHTPSEAKQDLDAIWEPFGVWKEFVQLKAD